MASMLPNKMTMKFEEGRYVTELTAGMGMFRMRFISNTKDKILYHTLDMMDDKKMVEMNEDGARKMLKSFPKLKILDEQGTDSLAGLPCKRALGFFAPSDEPPMEIYHTDRIALKEPNWCNQFHELKGVLLGYEVMRFGKRMRLRATQVEAKEIPEKAFTTDKYEQVSVEEMNRTMEKLMESLN